MANPGPSTTVTANSQAAFSNFQQMAIISLPVVPVAVAAATVAEQSFTLAGLLVTDAVYVSKPSVGNALGIVNARVSAANTLTVAYVNPTAAALTPAAETYQVIVNRPAPLAAALTAMPIL